LPRAVHGRPGRDDRERRAAPDPDGTPFLERRSSVGHQRVHADLRRLPALRRPRSRPLRAPPPVRDRRCHLLDRVADQRARYVPESVGEERHSSVDLAGAFTVTTGLVTLVYAMVKAQEFGWTSGRTLGLAAVAAGLLAAFVWVERRSKAPLVRLDIFRNRSL